MDRDERQAAMSPGADSRVSEVVLRNSIVVGGRAVDDADVAWMQQNSTTTVGDEADRRMEGDEVCEFASCTLSSLGAVASKICCVMANPDMLSDELRTMNFAGLHVLQDLRSDSSIKAMVAVGCEVILVLCQCHEVSDVATLLESLNKEPSLPPRFAILLQPTTAEFACNKLFTQRMSDIRSKLFGVGVSDVISMFVNQRLLPHRIHEAIHRTDFQYRRATNPMALKRRELQEQAARKVRMASRKYMMSLPGSTLEYLPVMDPDLKEHAAEDGALLGIGKYTFVRRLGGSKSCEVFAAEHLDGGTFAVKVIPKASIMEVHRVFFLNNEMGIMRYLPPHRNVMRAFEAFHTKANFIFVMQYGGWLTLQQFMKEHMATIRMIEGRAINEDVVKNFSAQQAAAVSHLHGCYVCHRDLNPCVWVVDDDHQTLRLTNFGFSVVACSLEQPMKHACASLPYCAPEVLRVGLGKERNLQYNGFAADIWSLSLNFLALAHGSATVEKILGWGKRRRPVPQDIGALESLEGCWDDVLPDVAGLKAVVGKMLLVRPDVRWTIRQVIGPEGLNLGICQVFPPRMGKSGRRMRTGEDIKHMMGDVSSLGASASTLPAQEAVADARHPGNNPAECPPLREKSPSGAAFDEVEAGNQTHATLL